ncbi:hypothetical protein ACFX2A_031837 [Malus domestica]
MKIIFPSHKLWDLVEKGYDTSTKKEEELTEVDKKLMRENIVKDARALGIIQSAKAAWDILKQEFVGDKQGYEQRLDRHVKSSMEKAFASLNIALKPNRFKGQINNNKYQKNFKSKGKQWGNKADWSNKTGVLVKNETNNTGDKCKFCDRLHYGECWVKNKVKCHKCNKIGHIARYCNTNKVVQQVNLVHQVEKAGNLFYANHSGEMKKMSDVWYIDSGCSNHMTSMEDLLVNIDRNVKAKVQVSTGVLVKVAGKGTLVIKIMKGMRYIKEVMLVPDLAENLLSVGQMTKHGYFLLFRNYRVDVFDDRSLSNLVVSVKQKGNRWFPLIFSTNKELTLRTMQDDAKMWHKRFGHLNFRSLKLLQC